MIADGSPDYLAVVGGALRTGVVPVPLAEGAPADDRAYLLENAEVSALVGPAEWPALRSSDPVGLAPVPLSRPMLYTSGTTGRRKGVWAGIWDDGRAQRVHLDEQNHWQFTSGDVHLVCSPLYHSAPLRFVLHTLLAGGEVVLQDGFDPGFTLEALESGGITTSFMAPAHLQRIIDDAGPRPTDLRWVAHAGAPCPDILKRRVLDWIGPERVFEFYGSTEAQFTSCRGDEWLANPGTVGRARPGRTLIIDDDSTIWCTQPEFARFEYWRSPEKTASAWRGDACSVGDLGEVDDSGRLFLRGRRDDLIVSGGVNVYPAEVERVFHGLADLETCVAYGLPDERWGQIVACAYTGSIDEATLRDHARRHLAAAARPKRYVHRTALPVSPTGKLSRRLLVELDGG